MTICLNMIVKNESHVIEDTLESLYHVIDTYCIVDTGSTDNTVELILNFMESKGIDGKILHRPWVNFAHNRNEALAAARGMAD